MRGEVEIVMVGASGSNHGTWGKLSNCRSVAGEGKITLDFG